MKCDKFLTQVDLYKIDPGNFVNLIIKIYILK
jgi:hypothetical protein